MNEQELSLRLKRVGDQVPFNARMADIGSDHAYLPVALMLQGKISYAVAGEVVKGPFQSAQKQVAKNALTDQIVVRLANGLDAILPEDRIDTITIAGMGGSLIRSILETGKAHNRIHGKETLILQPNVGEKTLREWLVANDYSISHEEILEENDKIYEIIVACGNQPSSYSEQELFFGPFLDNNREEVFKKKWQRELKTREYVLGELEKAEQKPEKKIAEIIKHIQWIKERVE